MWPFKEKENVSRSYQDEISILTNRIKDLEKERDELKDRSDRYWNLYTDLKNALDGGEIKALDHLSPYILRGYLREIQIKHEAVFDGDYCRIYNRQDHFTISFRREFDTTKQNHNWVCKGQALITLYLDNTGFSPTQPTIIKSPCYGIFESDNNKLIARDDEICRIKIYDENDEQKVKEQYDRLAIRDSIIRKERTKMIERQTLDELIEEGVVYNTFLKKDGCRLPIPRDVATAVWNRDGGRCCMCGARADLEFDHIIPLSKGGATTFRNLQLLCKTCNLKKSDHI